MTAQGAVADVPDEASTRRGAERHQHRAGETRVSSTQVRDRPVDADVDQYATSVAGVELEAVRAGPPAAPSSVLTVTSRTFSFNESRIGVPMLSRTTIPDGKVLVASVRAAPPGSRWCDVALEPAQVFVYAPCAEHMARNLPGLDFMFAICDVQELRTLASQFGSAIEVPEQGQVHLMARTPATSLVASAFAQFADLARSGVAPTGQHGDVVLHAMTHALMDQERTRRIGRSQRIDSRRVVLTCIDFAESVGRIPSIAELCAAAHLSERRLREAFTEEYGMPPTRFFRAWALGEAHRRLAHCDPGTDTVTQVAADLGFDHLGRFSGHYREIFEEHPSQTLNAD